MGTKIKNSRKVSKQKCLFKSVDIAGCVVAEKMEPNISKIVRQEQDRYNYSLNPIAYGIPPQADTAHFIWKFLEDKLKVNVGNIMNIWCLPKAIVSQVISSMQEPSYPAWLAKLKLPAVVNRRNRGDAILAFKLIRAYTLLALCCYVFQCWILQVYSWQRLVQEAMSLSVGFT